MKPVIYTNSKYYDSDTEVALTDSYVTSSWNHDINPVTSTNWTWAEIDNLEVGVALIGSQFRYSNCTQVYVEVNYTPSASPFLYLYKNNKFTKLSDFIPKATSKEKEYTQSIDITNKLEIIDGKVKLKITEELDETTYLDRIYLRIDVNQIIEPSNIKSIPFLKSLSEQNYLSQINKQLLKYSDNNYLIMNKGNQYLLEFYISKNYYKIEFVSEGYFIKN
jgi:hypothetical protein